MNGDFQPAPILRIEDSDRRRALASPLRLELVGQFTSGDPLSIAELAARMGRPPTSLYYHVRRLERVGLLVRVGERVESGRPKALYLPAATRFEMSADPDDGDARRDAVHTMASAFRMAEAELDAALADPGREVEGPARKAFATRLHARLTPEALARVNEHIDALMELLQNEQQQDEIPPDAEHFVSLTLALLPLRDREAPRTGS